MSFVASTSFPLDRRKIFWIFHHKVLNLVEESTRLGLTLIYWSGKGFCRRLHFQIFPQLILYRLIHSGRSWLFCWSKNKLWDGRPLSRILFWVDHKILWDFEKEFLWSNIPQSKKFVETLPGIGQLRVCEKVERFVWNSFSGSKKQSWGFCWWANAFTTFLWKKPIPISTTTSIGERNTFWTQCIKTKHLNLK